MHDDDELAQLQLAAGAEDAVNQSEQTMSLGNVVYFGAKPSPSLTCSHRRKHLIGCVRSVQEASTSCTALSPTSFCKWSEVLQKRTIRRSGAP